MTKSKRTTGLGRGLSALMADDEESVSPASTIHAEQQVPIHKLVANPFQPRRNFDAGHISELADSIKQKGVIQPILVRPAREGDGYEIIAGERRWRAAQTAGIHEVPIVLRDLDDTEALELAIVENVQRQDLTPVEEARGYRKLIDDFGHTQDAVARAVGKSRSHLANTLRLLTLPQEVLDWVEAGKLSAGHARTLVGRTDARDLAERIIKDGLTVRQAETMAQAGRAEGRRSGRPAATAGKDADTRALEGELAESLGLKVTIDHRGQKGQVSIHYTTLDQLDELCRRLTG